MSRAFKDFARGMGQAFDMASTLAPPRIASSQASQGKAIHSYWRRVGGDIRSAMTRSQTRKRS